MDNLETYRIAIERLFREWESVPRVPSDFRIDAIVDRAHDRYVLQDVDLTAGKYLSRTLAHLEIRDGKIWILADNTERGVAADLVAAGVPKDHIVLAFYPPALREMGEFAVA